MIKFAICLINKITKKYYMSYMLGKGKHYKEITELYKENKVLQIYNAGTKVYIWERDN